MEYRISAMDGGIRIAVDAEAAISVAENGFG